MPIYEFKCADCGRITNLFVRSVSSEFSQPKCEHCGSERTSRAVSKFGIGRTTEQIIEQYGDASSGEGEYRDPRQIGRWVETRFQEYGMEMPEGARELIDAAREGEFPKPLDDV